MNKTQQTVLCQSRIAKVFEADPDAASNQGAAELQTLLKFDWFIHRAALWAKGTIHIRVIGIHTTATHASEYFVLTGCGFKPTAAHLGINGKTRQHGQQANYISQDQSRD